MGAAAADDPLQHADGRRDALGRFDARERVLEGTCGIRRGGWRGRGRCLIHPRHSALSVYPQNEAHRQASWPRMIAKSGANGRLIGRNIFRCGNLCCTPDSVATGI